MRVNAFTPLQGIRILDFCWIGAGALVTKTLAELGATVYRVESATHPDNLRLSPPFRPGAENIEGSGYFASRNPSKRSVAINMATERGRELAREMAVRVDVVTSNFRPGIMERWGMDYQSVQSINPRVVYLTMPMQGATGPHASYIGFGSTISALSGLVALSTQPGRTPVGTGTHYPDHVPNPGHALVALLAAIRHSRRTGQGQSVELSQLESTVNIVGPAVLEASAGHTPRPNGNRTFNASPRAVFRCNDALWCAIACADDRQWSALAVALGLDELVTDPRFLTVSDRKRCEDDLEKLLAARIADFSRPDLLARLDNAGVPSVPVMSSRDIVDDAPLWDRGFWQGINHPVIGDMPISRMPFRSVGKPRAVLDRPPLLGEHTDDVLSTELGLTGEQIAQLRDDGVLQ